jgi:hypothetical protein
VEAVSLFKTLVNITNFHSVISHSTLIFTTTAVGTLQPSKYRYIPCLSTAEIIKMADVFIGGRTHG